jgi:hypothetical protein
LRPRRGSDSASIDVTGGTNRGSRFF